MNLFPVILDLNEILKTERYSRELLLSQYHRIYKTLKEDYHHNAALLLSLKIINMLVGKYERARKKTIIQNRPYGLIVDPSNGCNLYCPGCVHSLSQTNYDWPNGLITEESYGNFLNIYAPYAFYAFLYNYGEPFLNPLTPNLVKKSKNYLLDIEISSNLSIPRLDCKSIVESGLDTLIVSLDGVSQEIYSKYRRNGNVDVVFGNIRSLVLEKKETGSNRPYIIWQYLVFEHNSHEIELAKIIAQEIGVDELHLARPFSVSMDDPNIIIKEDFHDEHITFNKRISCINEDINALAKNQEIRLEFTLFDNLIPIQSREDILSCTEECSFLYNTISMDANNRILPCCAAPVKESIMLVFDHFLGNNYSFNNELFIDARKNAYTLSGRESSDNKPYCYYCSYHGPGLLNPIERRQERYLLDIGNKKLRKCIDYIVANQPLVYKLSKAIYGIIAKVSPKLAEYCKRLYKN
jgi:MoaA/NifB/PqqE/SkfB family radical SAM enzyme